MSLDVCRKYVHLRRENVSWGLLASRRVPLIVGCLKPLFEDSQANIVWEDGVEKLAAMFAEYANYQEFEIPSGEEVATARSELREWMKRGLIVERDGHIIATAALQKAFHFLDTLNDSHMTSTASRLATVQREIENLEAQLNPDRAKRAEHLKRRIASLEVELERVERGDFEVLAGARAQEGIREVYQLALSLRADFRRVEDSYRSADRTLRQNIVRSDQNRGSVLDLLLDGYDALLETPEGSVFDGFYRQLSEEVELEEMKSRLRSILDNPETAGALSQGQRADLRWLVPGLVRESERVIQARARGERDVRGFIKTGLAGEQHRVGALLNDLFEAAADLDWSSMSLRRSLSPLPPMAVSVPLLPLVQRLRFKDPGKEDSFDLDLSETSARLDDIAQDFWDAFDGLDRKALYDDTLRTLKAAGRPLTVSELAAALQPAHDLETLAWWIGLGRETGADFSSEREVIETTDRNGIPTRFNVPKILLKAGVVAEVGSETLG